MTSQHAKPIRRGIEYYRDALKRAQEQNARLHDLVERHKQTALHLYRANRVLRDALEMSKNDKL